MNLPTIGASGAITDLKPQLLTKSFEAQGTFGALTLQIRNGPTHPSVISLSTPFTYPVCILQSDGPLVVRSSFSA